MVESYDANDGRKAGDGRHCVALEIYTFARRQTRRHGINMISDKLINGESYGQFMYSSAKAQPWHLFVLRNLLLLA